MIYSAEMNAIGLLLKVFAQYSTMFSMAVTIKRTVQYIQAIIVYIVCGLFVERFNQNIGIFTNIMGILIAENEQHFQKMGMG